MKGITGKPTTSVSMRKEGRRKGSWLLHCRNSSPFTLLPTVQTYGQKYSMLKNLVTCTSTV